MNQGSHTAKPPAAARLNVRFFEKVSWNVAIKAASAPDFRGARRRVLALCIDADASREDSSFDSLLARAMAWAVLRIRAAASSLGAT